LSVKRRLDFPQRRADSNGVEWPTLQVLYPCEEDVVKAIVDLFSTDYGLFSVGVIVFMLYMAYWFSRFFKRKMAEDAANAEREASAKP